MKDITPSKARNYNRKDVFIMLLWENIPGTYTTPTEITYYPPENKTSDGAVIIFPGGAYCAHTPYEGEGYAEFFAKEGICSFVVNYRVTPHGFPLPLLDARRAVRWVRHHAEEYGINPHKIAVMGSSAGGHLAALVSTYRGEIEFEGIDEIDNEDYLPDYQILCYPVISTTDFKIMHYGSLLNLVSNPGQIGALAKPLSPELIADEKTPPAFIWHTMEDGAVPFENSLRYAEKLHSVGTDAELHIYPHGRHGLAMLGEVPHTATWVDCLKKWLKLYEF